MKVNEYRKITKIGDVIKIPNYDKEKEFIVNNEFNLYDTVLRIKSLGVNGMWHQFGFNFYGNHDVVIIKSSNKSMSDLKTKFSLLLKSEPEKSFIQAGIIDSNETLTPDGQTVFLSWLLSKNGDAFKAEVVDKLLASDKE